MNEKQKRQKMRDLCAIAGTYGDAAQILSDATRRPVSVDSIKAWTCDEKTSRARPCRDWVITVLEQELRSAKKLT